MSKLIRIGIVGAGANTVQRHIPELMNIENIKIVSVCNRSRQSSENVARRFSIPNTADYWTDVVEDDEVDAVLIGTWPYMHAPITIGALANNKHVLCEARMAMNLREATQMYDASLQKPALVSQLVPAPMTLRVDKMLQMLMASRFAGDIISIELRDFTGFPDWTSPLHWRENIDYSGQNIMSLGIWYECAVRWLGIANNVTAMGSVTVKTRKGEDGLGRSLNIPDHLEVLADMDCGAIARYTISRVCGFAGPPSLTIYGTDGTIRFSGDTLEAGKRGESMSVLSIPAELEGGWRVERDFIESIRYRRPITLTTFADGLKYMQFTDAVNRSLASGESAQVYR